MPFLPPMTNGNHTTYKNGESLGLVYEIVLPTWMFFPSDFAMKPKEF